jgi:hypothetical protein
VDSSKSPPVLQTEADAFCGFASIEAVRDVLTGLQAGISSRDNRGAYENDFVDAAAALEHFEPAEFGRLGINLKGKGIGVSKWERIVRERARRERERISEERKATQGAAKAGRQTQADTLVQLALKNATLFHDNERGYATVLVNKPLDHFETMRLGSGAFKTWLSHLGFVQTGKAPNREAISTAINTLSGHARFEGQEIKVHLRVAGHDDGNIYIDLGDPEWRAVQITKVGWSVLPSSRCPVKFRRASGMRALSVPAKGGSLNDLRPFVNVGDDDDFVLVVAWLLAALRPSGPYPVLDLHGEQGSGKSMLTRMLRQLIDPNLSPLRAEPKEVGDLMIAAYASWVPSFDNVSGLPAWLSDAFCRLSTGGGIGKRQLYTDDDEVILDVMRPLIVNGINEIAQRPDLLDRTIQTDIPLLAARKSEQEIYAAFDVARPKIFGALLDAVALALAHIEQTTQLDLPRMADFCRWVTAAERGFVGGPLSPEWWEDLRFTRSYKANRRGANQLALDASAVAGQIQEMLAQQPDQGWSGNAKALLETLNRLRGGDKKPEAGWPKTPHALSWALRRVSPNLRAAGIEVALPDKADKRRIITIIAAKVGETLPKTPTSPTAGKNPPDPSTFMAEGVGNVGNVGIQNPTLQSSDEGETDPEATTVVIDNDDDEEVPF